MRKIVLVVFIALITLLAACTQTETYNEQPQPSQNEVVVETTNTNVETNSEPEVIQEETVELEEVEESQPGSNTESEVEAEPAPVQELSNLPEWQNTVLTDVRDGSTFKISDFSGKPVFIESFAVWCPTCTRQQFEFKDLHEKLGDSVVSIGLNTDPNEDREKVLDHMDEHGFDWRYSISPESFTQELINEFGISIVNAPGAPVILVCGDGDSYFLDRGVKDVSELEESLAEFCNV